MDKNILNELIDKVNKGTATYEELGLYNEYLNQTIARADQVDLNDIAPEGILKQQLLRSINKQIGFQSVKAIRLWPRIAAAASIIVALSFGGYLMLHKSSGTQIYTANNSNQDIHPGTNGAILTLANGQKIVLEQTKVGSITEQNGTRLKKAGDSSLVYQSSQAANATIAYNTLETPKGRQYSVVLPDGSKVWLNAASSITYPTAFTGKERKVAVTGEAYFEVVHNEAHPFVIEAGGQIIEDIGTEFNINAYSDEPVIRTALVKGSVKVSTSSGFSLLKPGQAAVSGVSQSLTVKDIDVDAEASWRNGYFIFDNENLESVMRKISRWYNVDIKYLDDQKIPESYLGSITRFDNVSKVLQMLEITGRVRFKIEGRTILVMKK